jgi:hypothetical protein
MLARQPSAGRGIPLAHPIRSARSKATASQHASGNNTLEEGDWVWTSFAVYSANVGQPSLPE